MSDKSFIHAESAPQSPFEQTKQVDPDGNDFWSARDLLRIFGYANYLKFKNVLQKAQIACENSGHDPADHFYHAVTMVAIGSNTKREVEDIHLSRYACYLVVQNADPSKELVALGQTYFAMQTRRQEVADAQLSAQVIEDQSRLENRRKIRRKNIELASAAKKAGVLTPLEFSVFQNYGYRGLYNGLNADDIHRRKHLKKSQQILDHMGNVELIANLFRSSQAEEKLRIDNIQSKERANDVHFQTGVIVRQAMQAIGTTMPENLPTPDSIKKLERQEKKQLAANKHDTFDVS